MIRMLVPAGCRFLDSDDYSSNKTDMHISYFSDTRTLRNRASQVRFQAPILGPRILLLSSTARSRSAVCAVHDLSNLTMSLSVFLIVFNSSIMEIKRSLWPFAIRRSAASEFARPSGEKMSRFCSSRRHNSTFALRALTSSFHSRSSG